MAKFTDKSIAGLKPKSHRYELAEPGGLTVRVSPGGAKTFAYVYRFGSQPTRRVTLGLYRGADMEPLGQSSDRGKRALPFLSLSDARIELAKVRKLKDGGIDPGALATAERRRVRKSLTVADLIDTYLAEWAKPQKKASSATEDARQLNRDVRTAWRSRKAASITRSDVRELLAKVKARSPKGVAANRLGAVLSGMFKWAVGEEIIDRSPVIAFTKNKEHARKRALADAELAEIWTAAGKLNGLYGPLIRMLVATGQRRGEVAGLRLSEIALGQKLWTIPGERTKNGLLHEVPLSTLAIEIYKARLAKKPEGFDCLFASGKRGDAPPVEFKAAKRRLDALILEARRAIMEAAGDDPADAEPIPAWSLHDLRRSMRTGMAKLRLDQEACERVLNHVPRGMIGTYNVHSYRTEKRECLAAWANHLRRIIDAKPKVAGKVVKLRPAGG